jgi:transcriptional regulator with XRE-family HTH domain
MLKERPELTQSEIAREVGVSQQMVSKVTTNSLLAQKRLYLPVLPMIRLTLDPARVAAKIFQKMGEQYALQLSDSLRTQTK